MQGKDYYAILGVPRGADKDTIRRAYRELAKKHHPDANAGVDGERFKDIAEAYDVLSNPDKKAQYDNPASKFVYSDIGSIFGNVFSAGGLFNGGRPCGRRFSPNQRIILQVNMDQAYVGASVSFDAMRARECGACRGFGSRDSVGEKCGSCGGLGKKGFSSCGACRGSGKKSVLCEACGGVGWSEEKATINVVIPSRTISGGTVVMKGQGNVSADGTRGDFMASIHYAPSFDGVDLMPDGSMLKNIKVPWESALLGEEFAFKIFKSSTVDERIRLDPSIPNGWVYANGVKGRGMLPGSDLLVKVWYDLPTNINQKGRESIARAIKNAKSSRAGGEDST